MTILCKHHETTPQHIVPSLRVLCKHTFINWSSHHFRWWIKFNDEFYDANKSIFTSGVHSTSATFPAQQNSRKSQYEYFHRLYVLMDIHHFSARSSSIKKKWWYPGNIRTSHIHINPLLEWYICICTQSFLKSPITPTPAHFHIKWSCGGTFLSNVCASMPNLALNDNAKA